MPMVSPAQHRLMEGVAHDPKFARKVGIKSSVGKDFVAAGDAFAGGGTVNKGYLSKTENYAKGGAVLGQTSRFMKTPDQFREDKSNATDENFAKGSKGGGDGGPAAPAAKDKSLKPVKPR